MAPSCAARSAIAASRVRGAAAALARLYAAMRLFVNFFQPSFKLAAKARDGARVRKRYHPPATPCQRLLADARTNEEGATPRERAARHVGPSSSATANPCGPAA